MAKKSKKVNKIQEFRSMSEQDLQSSINEATLRLKKMTFSHAITPIDNPMGIRINRREIAQMQTELRRKQLGF
ncbi:MAG: 50S ribosomal protein L29 [Chitinophagaceae bacterium]|nr:MAG: 50S ribosomal protein L29 [Bacteroidetes bacterium OLB11]MCC6448775.1 50S ribosomal protein L29 [Chitinophagaceae bacterium]HMN33431.1 50S ribosomal protein L29 [Chitinophagaceae bacterium]